MMICRRRWRRQRYRGKTPLGQTTLYRWMERGVLPKPTVINGRNYWRIEELDAYDKARGFAAHVLRREAARRAA
jgi:predicted DNA-binding transcriptional regulator AlpA